jgi:hypothetical protein
MRECARQLIKAALHVRQSFPLTVSATWRRHGQSRICGDGGCSIAAADVNGDKLVDVATPIMDASTNPNVGASIATLALAIESAQRAPPI